MITFPESASWIRNVSALEVEVALIRTAPPDVKRILSEPAVSTETVSSAGNLIAVLVSPAWIILSDIVISPVTLAPVASVSNLRLPPWYKVTAPVDPTNNIPVCVLFGFMYKFLWLFLQHIRVYLEHIYDDSRYSSGK